MVRATAASRKVSDRRCRRNVSMTATRPSFLSGSLMDYGVPRADTLPLFQTEISEVPSTTNPLGMRGGSEGGITPGLAAVANAIVDALAGFGVEHIELPATPERIWRAIHNSAGDHDARPTNYCVSTSEIVRSDRHAQ